jgi:Flp pilus assembly protein TadB
MQDLIIHALSIIGVCLLIAIVAVILIMFRPAARRRRRRRRHSKRPKIDLFAPPESDRSTASDA